MHGFFNYRVSVSRLRLTSIVSKYKVQRTNQNLIFYTTRTIYEVACTKGAMKFIDLSGDSEFESRLEWAKYLQILSMHYADAFNMIL